MLTVKSSCWLAVGNSFDRLKDILLRQENDLYCLNCKDVLECTYSPTGPLAVAIKRWRGFKGLWDEQKEESRQRLFHCWCKRTLWGVRGRTEDKPALQRTCRLSRFSCLAGGRAAFHTTQQHLSAGKEDWTFQLSGSAQYATLLSLIRGQKSPEKSWVLWPKLVSSPRPPKGGR